MEPFFASIPGYEEAVAREQSDRELSFIDLPIPLCGVSVRQMTPMHLLILKGCENRIVIGGHVRESDFESFLWVVSIDYQPGSDHFVSWSKRSLKAFRKNKAEGSDAIRNYIERTFMDTGPSSEIEPKLYTASVAFLVDLFGVEYGWTDSQVLNCPLARLYQLMKQIHMRRDPKAPRFNKSDAIISRWLQKRNEEAAKNGF